MPLSFVLAVTLGGCQPSDPTENGSPTDTIVTPTEPVVRDPGFMPMHRLNNTEYVNTVRDLLLSDHTLGVTFPPDPVDHGFDNVAELLSVSPLLVEVYEAASTEILDDFFADKNEVEESHLLQAEGPGTYFDGGLVQGVGYSLAGGGAVSFPFNLPYDGTYDVVVRAIGREADGAFPQIRVLVDGLELEKFEVTAAAPGADYKLSWPIDNGITTVKVEFVNPDKAGLRGLVLDYVRLDGPTDPEVGRSAGYIAIVEPCDEAVTGEAACAEQLLTEFLPRAWRRPVDSDEVAWAMSVYDEAVALGLSYDYSLQSAMKAAMLAPEFIFRLEADATDEPRWLDGYELASRLSYFLWSSMPDEALFAAAADGSLLTDEGLQAQVVRMMADDKAQALVDSFASQWLDAGTVDGLSPVMVIYPDFDEPLRRSMKEEVLKVAEDYVLNGVPVDQMFTSEETWIDARLAEHYGVPFDTTGPDWQLVNALPARQGVLGTAGWLAAHSHGERPSVVLRGKWVLEDLLCQEVPPPPPGVETSVILVDDAGTVREQEEAARLTAGGTCVACHAQMDPYGHAFGNFDGIGAERAEDELGFPIDTEVTLPTGEEVESILGALPLLVTDPRFSECVAEKAFRYGLGRSLRVEDGPYLEGYTSSLVSNDLVFEAVVSSIVLSDPFRMKGPLVEE